VNQVIVIEFATLDGIVEDPDGSRGTPGGGWAFRYGPETVAGDKFRLGSRLDDGTMLLGRRTWELFAALWPNRSDPFAQRMNRVPKAVVSRTLTDAGRWRNSAVLSGDLLDEVGRLRERGDVVITGSLEVVGALRAADLVDEYRLLVFPTVLGRGRRLFDDGSGPEQLRLVSVDHAGAAVLMRHERAR